MHEQTDAYVNNVTPIAITVSLGEAIHMDGLIIDKQ